MAEGFGTCTWPYAIVDGVRTHISDAARLQHGVCPVCGAELVARKGKFREDHWWHVNGKKCDPWYQPKGPWHLYWQNMFPKECQEVVVEGDVDGTRVRHIADVKTPGGIVLEVQYSAISPETIAIREDFYGNMLWLANMRRIESDMSVLVALQRNGPYAVDDDAAWIIEDTRLLGKQKWFLAKKPVAFDFAGWFEKPGSEEHLYCLLPEMDGVRERVCFEIDRHKLMDALRSGSCGRLFRRWKEAIPDVLASHKAVVEERKQKADADAKATREAYRKERRESLARQLQAARELAIAQSQDAAFYEELGLSREEIGDFITGQFDQTLHVALSLGWVEVYMIYCELIAHNSGVPVASFDFPKMGRLVLHYVKGYTYEEFKKDVEKAKSINAGFAKTLDYEKLRKLEGKVVAAADYFVCAEGENSGVLIRNVRRLNRQFDLWTQKVGFTKISEKQSDYFSSYDREFWF